MFLSSSIVSREPLTVFQIFHSLSIAGTQPLTVFHMVTCSTGPLQFASGGETETLTLLPGETAEFEFSVLSYTSTISSCTLTRAVMTQNQDNTISCHSSRRWRTWCTVTVFAKLIALHLMIARHTIMCVVYRKSVGVFSTCFVLFISYFS